MMTADTAKSFRTSYAGTTAELAKNKVSQQGQVESAGIQALVPNAATVLASSIGWSKRTTIGASNGCSAPRCGMVSTATGGKSNGTTVGVGGTVGATVGLTG